MHLFMFFRVYVQPFGSFFFAFSQPRAHYRRTSSVGSKEREAINKLHVNILS